MVLTDWAMRRSRLSTPLLFDRRHRNRAGVGAFLLGVAACVPFMNQTLYTGWVASALPQTGDLSFVSGFAVSAAAYVVLEPRTRRRRRLPACRRALDGKSAGRWPRVEWMGGTAPAHA